MPSSSWSLSSSSLASSSGGSKLPGSGLQNRNLSLLATRNHRPWHICCYCCCCSVAKSCLTPVTPWIATHHASLSFPVSQSVLKFMSIESVMLCNHLILCHSLLLLLSIFLSIRVFSDELALCIRWPKYWHFSITSSNEYSGLISLRIDWFDLLAVQATFKSLLQHHSSKASILQYTAFFMVQLSHPYMTTGKPIALTRWAFVGKVMSLFFSTLSWLVIAFLPRLSFNSMAAVTICSDFGAQENKVCHCFQFPHLFPMKWWDWMLWS